MIVSINQPAYLPWMGYFDRIKKSDLHIVLDHVQLEKGGFTNRTRIMQPDGRPMWLTIPVEKGKPINETRAVGVDWARKHREALRQAYGLNLHALDSPWLVDVIGASTWWMLRELRDETPFLYSSDASFAVARRFTKSELVLNLCKEVGATTYLSGPNGRDYLDLPAFEKAGIEVRWHDYPVVRPVLSAVHDLFSAKVAA